MSGLDVKGGIGWGGGTVAIGGATPAELAVVQQEIVNTAAQLWDRDARAYINRGDAVALLQRVPSSVHRAVVIEGDNLVVRGRDYTAIDPLFSTGYPWGVAFVAASLTALANEARDRRQEIANAAAKLWDRDARAYINRADAVNLLQTVPPSVHRAIVIENGEFVIRGRDFSANDPLFESGFRWGVAFRSASTDSLVSEVNRALGAERALAVQIDRKADISLLADEANIRQLADQSLQQQLDTVVSGIRIVGEWDPALGGFPASRPDGAAIVTGDSWNVRGTGVVAGVSFAPGDVLTALVDAPAAAFEENWTKRSGTATRAQQVSTDQNGVNVQQALDIRPLPYDSRLAVQRANLLEQVQTLAVVHSGVVLEYIRDQTGSALLSADGGKWSPSGREVTPLHWGAVGDGITDDAPAIQQMFTWVNAMPSATRPAIVFPPGFTWRVGSTCLCNWRGGRGSRIDMQSAICPDPGIGDALQIINGRGGDLSLRVEGGGQDADYSQANPVGCDQAFMLRGLRGPTVIWHGYNYKGRVMRITKNLPSEFKTSRFNIPFIQTGDISGETANCGQSWFIDTGDTAFGSITRAWPNYDKYGPVFEDTTDINIGSIEAGFRGLSGIDFRGCGSVWYDKIEVGDESFVVPFLLRFGDSATKRSWNIAGLTIFAIGGINGVELKNVGLAEDLSERPGANLGHVTTHKNSGVGLRTEDCANLKIGHDSHQDGMSFESVGALTNSEINLNYRSSRGSSLVVNEGGGNGLKLAGSVKNANAGSLDATPAVDIRSLENIESRGLILAGSGVSSLLKLRPGNGFRMFEGSMTVGGSTVKFEGSPPRLASNVRGYTNKAKGKAVIPAGQSNVVVPHGMDVAPEFIFTQERNSDPQGKDCRPSTIGATTFVVQTKSGSSVSADSTVDWEAKAGNAP